MLASTLRRKFVHRHASPWLATGARRLRDNSRGQSTVDGLAPA